MPLINLILVYIFILVLGDFMNFNCEYSDAFIHKGLKENILLFNKIFKNDDVFRIREIDTNICGNTKCALLFFDGMINTEITNESVIKPLLLAKGNSAENRCEHIKKRVLYANEVESTNCIRDILKAILYGDSALLIDQSEKAIIINTKGWRTRGVNEPTDERVLQGPREGFDESVMLNAALLRRKLPTPDLSIELITKGRKTDTKMFLCYLDSIADKGMVKEIKRRIAKIDIDGILDSNYINEQIKSHRNSLFKTCGTTERPDIVAAKLLEGRVALIVDGSPVVLTMPYIFCESFQSDDDYYLNYWYAAIGRVLRYISFFLAISVPAVYSALCIYHPYLLPTALATSIAGARSGIPFPTYVECFLLIFVFEILRETGIRMQQSMGHALSIVGGLVVGQSAVEAGFVSAPMLIAVALSGICGLMVPKLKGVIFYSRVGLTVFATLFGLFGYFVGVLLLLVRIFSLDSFFIPYTLSLSSLSGQSLKDTLLRAPWWKMIKRPPISLKNTTRQRSYEE